jgi:hypothetical protein
MLLCLQQGGKCGRNPLGHETTVVTTNLSPEARSYFGELTLVGNCGNTY